MHTRNKRTAMLSAVGLPMAMAMLWTTGVAGAHGGDSSQVHACVVPASGAIHIVEPGQSCAKNETALDWTREGGRTYSAGSGLALSADNQLSVIGAPWSGLTGVPLGFADGIDDDASAEVAQLEQDLASGSVTILGSSIMTGSVSAAQLAGEYRDHDLNPSTIDVESIVGAVTSEKIADGTISARDLNSELVVRLRELESRVAALEAEVAVLKG